MLYHDQENHGPPSQTCSSSHAVPGSFRHLDPLDERNEIHRLESAVISGCEISAHELEPSFPETHFNDMSVFGDNLSLNLLSKGGTENQFKHVGEDVESECMFNLQCGLDYYCARMLKFLFFQKFNLGHFFL